MWSPSRQVGGGSQPGCKAPSSGASAAASGVVCGAPGARQQRGASPLTWLQRLRAQRPQAAASQRAVDPDLCAADNNKGLQGSMPLEHRLLNSPIKSKFRAFHQPLGPTCAMEPTRSKRMRRRECIRLPTLYPQTPTHPPTRPMALPRFLSSVCSENVPTLLEKPG